MRLIERYLPLFVHLFAGVLMTGYVLFRVVMVRGLRDEENPDTASRMLESVNESRWPPAGVPPVLRMRLPTLGWVFLGLLAVSGLALLASGDAGWGSGVTAALSGRPLLLVKLGLFGLLVAGEARAMTRPESRLAEVNGVVLLLVVLVSAFLDT